jgi:hypothetical protein
MDLVIIAGLIAMIILIWGLKSAQVWTEVLSGMLYGSLGGIFVGGLLGIVGGWLVPALNDDNSPALWILVCVCALIGMWLMVKRVDKRSKGSSPQRAAKPSRASAPSTSSRSTQIHSSHPLPDFSPQSPGTEGWRQQQAYNAQIQDARIQRNIAARGGVDDEGYPLG